MEGYLAGVSVKQGVVNESTEVLTFVFRPGRETVKEKRDSKVYVTI